MHYLIVGGSKGIGLALTKKLSEVGHHITVLSRSAESLAGIENVTHHPCDITQEAPNFRVIDAVDGLVYLPGTVNLKAFPQLKIEDYLQDFSIHFLGAVKVINHYLPTLVKSGHASIVLMSTVAVEKGLPFHCSVSAAKGAVTAFTRSLAAELAPQVRVNAVAPSLTETKLTEPLLDSDTKRERAAKKHPLGRIGQPGDIAAVIAYLLSSDAAWVTGQVFGVDGGLSRL